MHGNRKMEEEDWKKIGRRLEGYGTRAFWEAKTVGFRVAVCRSETGGILSQGGTVR